MSASENLTDLVGCVSSATYFTGVVSTNTSLLSVGIESFSLKEIVVAVADLLRGIVSRFVKIELINLCSDDVTVAGNKLQLKAMISNIVEGVEKSFKGGVGVISVIIHNLKRVSDSDLLPKVDRYFEVSSREKIDLDSAAREKYVALSVRRKLESSDWLKPRASESDSEELEISYSDTGVIVKKPSNVVMYIARFAA